MQYAIMGLDATYSVQHREFFDYYTGQLIDDCWLLLEEGILLNSYSTLQEAHEEAFRHSKGIPVTLYDSHYHVHGNNALNNAQA